MTWNPSTVRTSIAPVLAALLAVLLPGQGPPRQKVLGQVTASDGTPWPGAAVTLLGSSYPRYWQAGEPDRIQLQTDDRGRFEAAILPQRHYSAWASGPYPSGGFRLTQIQENVVPFTEVRLQERNAPQLPVRVRLEDLGQGARPLGPLSFQLMSRAPANVLVLPLRFDEHGEAALPPLPGTYVLLEAVTAAGVRVWLTSIALTQGMRLRGREPQPTFGVPAPHAVDAQDLSLSIVRLPAPTAVTFRVRSGKGGPALPGAEILVGAQSSFGSISDVQDCRPLALTDAMGTAVVPMYLSWQEDGTLALECPDVLVRAEHHGEQLFRMMHGLAADQKAPTHALPEGLVELDPRGHAVTGQLMLDANTPAAGVPVLLYAKEQLISTKPWVARTDPDGHFRIAALGSSSSYRLTALLPVRSATEREERYLAFGPACVPDTGLHDLGTIRTDTLRLLQFSVLGSDGAPVDRASLYVGELVADHPTTPLTFLTDKVGRCAVWVPRDQQLAVFAAHEGGFAVQAIEHGSDPAVVSLQLAAAGSLAGRVVDPEGRPLAGVRVYVRGAVPHGARDGFGPFLDGINSTTLCLDYRTILSDAQGRFRAAFPLAGVELTVSAWRRDDDGGYWEHPGKELKVQLDGQPVPDLQIVVERKQ